MIIRPEPITVTYLNKYIKDKVAEDEYLQSVYVKGEISNFKHHYTGHMYFTLKDENSLIKCIMFKSSTATLNFVPKDGMKVLVLGSVAVFERDGVYQIYAKAMQEDGIGDLYKEYEELKNKLEKEGYFDENHKRKIPFMPTTIGVLTSKTGSVIQDIINVSTRRNPNVNIKLFPIPVQGKGAELEIADAIRIMNEKKIADVLILARGGGSIEDLWPFNEEITARAIYNSKIPIISAVGHETDFTISDFVADLRAPTPSAAAELAVPDIDEVKNKIETYKNRYKNALKKKIEYMELRYNPEIPKDENTFSGYDEKSQEYIYSLLKKYNLYEFKDKYPSQLSGGMRQRVALIRTLAINPDILLLDEAFSALDYQTRLAVTDDVYSIIKNEGKTTIMVTHDIPESISMSDKVIVLSNRPAIIKNVHEISFDIKNRTPLQCRENEKFSKYFDNIWKELNTND